MVTLRTVAQAVGLSVQTVSGIINGDDPRYRPATRRRVQRVARRLGYRPHRWAQAVRTGKIKIIGVLTHFGLYQVAWERTRAITRAIERAGYEPLVVDAGDLATTIRRMADLRVDGMMIAGMNVPIDAADLRVCRMANIPIVTISSNRFPGIPSVRCDVHQGLRDLTQYVLQCGFTRVALLVAGNTWPAMERASGFQDAVRKAGGQVAISSIAEVFPRLRRRASAPDTRLRGDILWIKENLATTGLLDRVQTTLRKLLLCPRKPEAVLCSNDNWAIGALWVCAEMGLRVPRDVAITGFDNILMGQYVVPPLTTVAQPLEAMAQEATATLLRLIRKETLPADRYNIRLPCRIVVRQSCARGKEEP